MTWQFVVTILFIHWLADFVCQSDWMAKGKSSSEAILTAHIAVYFLVSVVCFMVVEAFRVFPAVLGERVQVAVWTFCILNALLHWITDWFTSRATKRLWEAKEVHRFFVVIGFDQLIHACCLLALASRL